MGDSGRAPAAVPVLAVGGHDPCGAGIQADIETAAALGCTPLTVITALTTQNTAHLAAVAPCPAADVVARITLVLEEITPCAVKLGLIPDCELGRALAELVDARLSRLPLVVDPLLHAGSGGALAGAGVAAGYLADLLPLATVATPNLAEARRLTGRRDPDQAAACILDTGCKAVLITDLEPAAATISNRLYVSGGAPATFEAARLSGDYHGTGCTLASAVACELARGLGLRAAVEEAQQFVHAAVAHAFEWDAAQRLPNRMFARRRSP